MASVQFILSSTFFTFDDIIYRQIYGTPMGSPLSPIFADIVIQDLEKSILDNIGIELSIYFRYVNVSY